MSNADAVSTLIVREPGIDSRSLELAIPQESTARTVDLTESAGLALATIAQGTPDLLVVAFGEFADGALQVIQAARERAPACAVVALVTMSPNGLMRRAFQAGADDMLMLAAPSEEIAFALEKALARRRGTTTASTGRMICIVGPKGGTGKTLTACNMSVALALRGHRTVVVDIDLQFGDIGVALALKPERTIFDLAMAPGALDEDMIEQYLVTHSSGMRALLAPMRPDQAKEISVDFLRAVYALLRRRFDYVVIDTPPAFSPEVIASIDAASDLLVVGMLDALSLKDTKIGLETLALMGYPPDKVKLVLNRADTSVGISLDDVEAILGRKPDVFVPSDRAVPRAITQGLPIVTADERSGPARAFAALADVYESRTSSASQTKAATAEIDSNRRSILRRR